MKKLILAGFLVLVSTPSQATEALLDRCEDDLEAAKARSEYAACVEVATTCFAATHEYGFAYHRGVCLEALGRWGDALATYDEFLRDAHAEHYRRPHVEARLEPVRMRLREVRWSAAMKEAAPPPRTGADACNALRTMRLEQRRGAQPAFDEGLCFEAVERWTEAKRAYDEFLGRPASSEPDQAARVAEARRRLSRVEHEIEVAKDDPAGDTSWRTGWGIGLLAGGVVVAGVGGGLLYWANEDTEKINASPDDPARDALDSSRLEKVWGGGIALGLGAAAAVTGTVLLLMGDDDAPESSTLVTPMFVPGGGGAMVHGSLPF